LYLYLGIVFKGRGELLKGLILEKPDPYQVFQTLRV
jgi:hypothetical protein